MKLFLEITPIFIFFLTYKFYGLMIATALLIGLTLISIPIIYKREGQLPVASVITAILVTIFGGLTLWLDDERFIKMKPTMIYLIFATILLGGLIFRKPLLKPIMSATLNMSDIGWFKLTRNFGIFFIFLAGINEIIWRNASTDDWVMFKSFGLIGLMITFTISQIWYLKNEIIEDNIES